MPSRPDGGIEWIHGVCKMDAMRSVISLGAFVVSVTIFCTVSADAGCKATCVFATLALVLTVFAGAATGGEQWVPPIA